MKTQFITFLLYCSIATIIAQSTNFNEGQKAFEAGDLDTALECFTKDISNNPRIANTYYSRGFVYYSQDVYAKALTDVNMGLKCISAKENKLKAVLYELRALIYTQLEEPEKALADYTNAIKTNGTDPDFYIGRAQLHFNKKLYDKAEADYASILKFDETNAPAHAGMARNYLELNKYAEADKLLSKLKKLHPKYDVAYYYSAKSAYNQNKFDEAIENSFMAFVLDDEDNSNRDLFIAYSEKNYAYALAKITNKINEEPSNYFWLYYKGILQENKEDYGDAVATYTVAQKLMTESNVSIYSHRANCYRNIGLQELAIADYNLALAIDSSRAFDYAFRGEAKRLKGEYTEAVKDYTQAIALEPRVQWFYYRRGWVNEEFLKNNTAGLRDYNKAIEIDKDYAYTYIHRGRFYKNTINDMQKANADFETILKLDTAIIDGGNCRQYSLLELGRETEAIVWMNKILDKYPNEGNYYDATCLYSLMKKPVEAVKYMTLAFENGYKDIIHLSNDDDLDNVRNNPEFKALIAKWKKTIETEIQRSLPAEENEPSTTEGQLVGRSVVVPMLNNSGGTYEVACKINNLPLNFIFDTGASDISISQTEVQFMLKNKYLSKSDIRGSQSFMDASGNVSVGTKILLRKVQIGNFELNNVEASVVHNRNAPLLFGQSALGKYTKIIIDNENKTITLSEKK
jgi:clan AA aspartic protease (TIGR02281 family)